MKRWRVEQQIHLLFRLDFVLSLSKISYIIYYIRRNFPVNKILMVAGFVSVSFNFFLSKVMKNAFFDQKLAFEYDLTIEN